MPFRCSVASLARGEPLAGTASTVRAFLLVENDGPWGVDALRDARLPDDVKRSLRDEATRHGIKVLLARRHGGSSPGQAIRVMAAYAAPAGPWMETTTLIGPGDLRDLDLAALARGKSPGLTPVEGPVVCVCTHGRHDACCAELGRPVATALHVSYPELTWEVSHIGGDRFAANLLVLPDGLYYGRVSAAQAAVLVRTHLDGRLELDLLRGRSGFSFPVQVAELAVRRETGEDRDRAVRLVSATRSGAETSAVFDVAGSPYTVLVRRHLVPNDHQLTCRALRGNPVPAYDVVSLNSGNRPPDV